MRAAPGEVLHFSDGLGGADHDAEDRERVLGPGGGERVHAIEHAWVAAMSTVRLYAYRFDARDFTPHGSPVVTAMVATTEVVPLGPARPGG